MATSRIWSFALNGVSLLCLLTGIYFAVQFHKKPLLAWDVPLHLSYQKIGTVGHSRSLARYDADLWNHAVQICGSRHCSDYSCCLPAPPQWASTMDGPANFRPKFAPVAQLGDIKHMERVRL